MGKLRLEVEALVVESFATGAEGARGTVNANEDTLDESQGTVGTCCGCQTVQQCLDTGTGTGGGGGPTGNVGGIGCPNSAFPCNSVNACNTDAMTCNSAGWGPGCVWWPTKTFTCAASCGDHCIG